MVVGCAAVLLLGASGMASHYGRYHPAGVLPRWVDTLLYLCTESRIEFLRLEVVRFNAPHHETTY
jgi:hypothetical protein